MMPAVLAVLLGVGLAVGFLAGLVGIGGGVLIVPFLYFFYEHPGWGGTYIAPELEVAVAHATSLFIIVPTAIRGAVAYHRAGLVVWRAVLPMAASAVVAAVAGARLALILPAELLKVAFGLLLVGAAWRMMRGGVAERARPADHMRLRALLTGSLVGFISALLGVGGGVVAIPLLAQVVGLELRQVAASSLAVVAFSAMAGTVTYIASGWNVAGLPPGSAGYVHLSAALPILVGSLVSVKWGALANQRLPARRLQWLFAVFFLVMGLRLIIQNAG